MKKFLVAILALICLFSFVGCGQNDISKYLKKKDGEQYLILPVSKEEIWVYNDELIPYLNDIDLGLLKKAENKLTAKAAQYGDKPSFHLYIVDGYLCLRIEIIVHFEERDENGMDHEHLFFSERITKKKIK